MAVRRGDLGAVGVVVHRGEGVKEAPHAGTEEGHHAGAERPQRGRLVGMLAAAAVDHVEGEHRHREERDRLERGEDRTPPLPVARRTDPEVVVAGADDAGDQGQRDDHVQPFLDHLAIDAGDLDQHEGQQGAEDQFPHAFDPQMHDPPPIELVEHQVIRVVEGEQEHHGEAPQAHQQHQRDRGLAPLQHRHADVEEEGQGDHDDADLGDQRLLEEFAPHGLEDVVAGDLRQCRVRHCEVADDGQRAGHEEDPEQRQRQLRRIQLGLGLFGDQVVGAAHEAEQQPYDQQVGVHHAGHVEGDGREQEVADHVLQAHDQAEQDLSGEQGDCRDEVGLRDGLGFVLHACRSFDSVKGGPVVRTGARVQPSTLGGQLLVSISELYLRNATSASSSSSLKLNCGIWRRPGVPVGCDLIQALMKSGPRRT